MDWSSKSSSLENRIILVVSILLKITHFAGNLYWLSLLICYWEVMEALKADDLWSMQLVARPSSNLAFKRRSFFSSWWSFNFYDKHLKSSSDYEQILAHFYPCFSSYESSTHKVVKEAGKHQCILKIVRSNVWSVSFTLKSLVSLAKSIQFKWPHWQKCRCGPSPVVKRRQDGQL